MLDALEKRVVDPKRTIAVVHGPGQTGSTLWIKSLNEKLWHGDTLYIGFLHFVPTENYEPSEEPIEIKIQPPLITSGLYRNAPRSPHDQEAIKRFPYILND